MKNTPHINLLNGESFAKTVLMPGDPLRAKMIAETFLQDAVLVNNVRGIQGYTGTYKGIKVSVMASGMGIPSIGIYAFELYSYFGVQNIIRVGSAGGISDKVKLRDVVAGIGANTNSNFANQYNVKGSIAATCSYKLLKTADKCANDIGIELNIGNLFSTDIFYDKDPDCLKKWAEVGSLAVEMEAAGLYLTANDLGKNALAICTISDLPFTGESCTAQQRQDTFTDMIKIALETALAMEME